MSTATSPDERATVIGINFGNSYASIAVITKEGTAECIANEDGERQIAAAIAFHGEELYIGNQATPQLIKNAENTITGFRNLLGKKFSEIDPSAYSGSLAPSARLSEHPSLPDTPCYAVQVLIPSPSPLPPSSRASLAPTPIASSRATPTPSGTPLRGTPLATPRSEPTPQTRYITPHDATVLFLRSLHTSATEFLGKTPEGAVICVPASFGEAGKEAIEYAAKEAGVKVMAVVGDDAAAASVLVDGANSDSDNNVSANSTAEASPDRTALLVDWGATSLTASLLVTRAGLVHILASKSAPELGTACEGGVDEVLVKHFAKEFAKKSGETLKVCPPTSASARAQTKLFLALPHVKRSLTTSAPSTQQKSTQISIESLHAGLDFSASLNRTRATGLLAPVFSKLAGVVREVLEDAAKAEDGKAWNGGPEWIDSILWVGGGGRLGAAGATDALVSAGVVGEDVKEEEHVGAPEEALARGCAMHAALLQSISASEDDALRGAWHTHDGKVMRKTLGVIVPEASHAANGDAKHAGDDEELGGQWIPVVWAETPIPARRTVRFSLSAPAGAAKSQHDRAAFEIWEVSEVVRVRKVKIEIPSSSDGEDEEEEEEEERERGVRKEAYLGVVVLPLTAPAPTKSKAKGAKARKVEVRFDVDAGGAVEVRAREEGGDWVSVSVGAK